MGDCPFYKDIFITVDVFNQKVLLRRCCFTGENIFEISIEEFNKIHNIVDFLNSFVDKWTPTRSITDICNRVSDTKECWTPTPPKKFEIFEIALDYTCNANCTFCCQKDRIQFVKQNKLNLKLRNLYYSLLNKIIDQIDYPIIIRLTDRGEPLFWKTDFISFFEKAQKSTFIKEIRITTNGLNFLNNEILSLLKKYSSKTLICCSINALTAETHKTKMNIGHFWEIINACNILNIFEYEYVVIGPEDLAEFENNIETFRKATLFPINLTYDNVSSNKKVNIQVCQEIKNKFLKYL